MVIPCGIVGAAGSAAATGVGLGMDKSSLEMTKDLFKLQMQQAKRLWTADWAEQSARHGEACMQSAQQHAESQAMATATYYQAERLAGQGIKLARDQDSRSYEMAWRSEMRESLRDELTNQNNRFNIIMLCDTVCLGCVFTLIADGSPPDATPRYMLNIYVFFLGLSTMLFSVSLWCAVVVVRRLHEHTASILERKLFSQSEDLQRVWRNKLDQNLPTGHHEMYLFNKAYEKWVEMHLTPLGQPSIQLLSVGVVAMFITAGLLVHNTYLIDYDAFEPVPIFWTMVGITSFTIIFMKWGEDRREKKKEGVYDISWYDKDLNESGPYAKINRAANELFSEIALKMADTDRMEKFDNQERVERNYCAKTQSLHHRVNSLRKEAKAREKMRKNILQLLTTAAEELDALPEELTSSLNKLLHDIDEADSRTANLVSMSTESMLQQEASHGDWNRLKRTSTMRKAPMAEHPIDAQRIPVSLASLRKKLGEISLTTLLRLRNTSDQPLRLKSGVQLKEGKYIKSQNATDPKNNPVCYYLYPGTEIPPRSEVVIAARSGGAWVPTSGIEGQLVYTSRDESWAFTIKFRNSLLGNVRYCRTEASAVESDKTGCSDEEGQRSSAQYWQIIKDEVDGKANNEYIITIDALNGREASEERRLSQTIIKSGILLKNKDFGLRLQWQQRYFVLSPLELTYAPDAKSKKLSKIVLKDIQSVHVATDIVKTNVFELYTPSGPFKVSAPSAWERDDWVRKISEAIGIDATFETDVGKSSIYEDESSVSSLDLGIECIESPRGAEVIT